MINVLITKNFLKSDIDYIKDKLLKDINLIIPDNFSEENLIKAGKNADVLLGSFISRSLLENCKNLKFIQIPWTGVEQLDFNLLNEYNITVCNSHSNSLIIAEHAIALMFDAAKKLTYHDRLMREGKWNRIRESNRNVIHPFSKYISHTKIGILGFGNVGKKIYSLLREYECHFIITKKFKLNEEYENLQTCSFYDFKAYLKDIDYVFVTLPLTEETKGIINKEFFGFMNKSSIFINVSRGEIVNETDLYYALKNNIIGSAGIDTWYNYPSFKNPDVYPSIKHDFHKLDNIILSPHRSGYIEDGFPHLDDAIDNLNKFTKNEQLINIVSLKNGY